MANELEETSKHNKRPPTLSVDWKLYEEYLGTNDLSDDQKRELIEALWYIVMTFVDLGFGLDPVQQVLPSAQEKGRSASKAAADDREDSSFKDLFAAGGRSTTKEMQEKGASDEI